MKRLSFRVGFLAPCLIVLAGCFSSEPKSDGPDDAAGQVEATPGQLVQTIIDMSHTPAQYSEKPERHIYTRQLASMGPTALTPLIEYMAAPETEDTARLFILQCVNELLTPVYLPSLAPMLESDDQVIRAIGVTAIGVIENESVVPLLQIARNDPAPRVAFSALSSLALQGDESARQELKRMYEENATMGDIPEIQIKREVIRVLVRDSRPEDLPILSNALNEPYVEVNFRAAIVRALGRLGDPSVIPLLEQSVELQKEDAYGKLVQQAIAAINEREGAA